MIRLTVVNLPKALLQSAYTIVVKVINKIAYEYAIVPKADNAI